MLDKSFMSDKQKQEFVNLMKHLFCFNKYFHCLLTNFNIESVEEITFEVYNQLSVLTKNDIVAIGDNYFSTTKEKVYSELTSGSTGIPFFCYKTFSERNKLALEIHKYRMKWDKYVDPKYFFVLFGDNKEYDLTFADYSDENLRNVFKVIKSCQARWLCGSPSVLFNYSKKIEQGVISAIDSVKFIELQGEYVEESTRSFIESQMNCKTIVHYGNRECWTIAYECPFGKLHLKKNVMAEVDNSEHGFNQLIVTTLINRYMPFIKYATGDIVDIIEPDCECGARESVIIIHGGRIFASKIVGYELLGDIVFKKIIHNVLEGFTAKSDIIRRYRISQIGLNKFVYFLDAGKNFHNDILSQIKKDTKTLLSSEAEVDFIFQYEDNPTGKYKTFSIDI